MALNNMEEIIIKQEIEELVREEELLTNSGSSEEKFLIVRFHDENSRCIVPSSWVDESWCFWPPIRNYKKILEMVKDMQSPDLSWSKVKVLVVESADSYDEAVALEKQAMLTSDSNTDAAEETEVRRGKKRPLPVVYDLEGPTDDESNQGDSSINRLQSNPESSPTPSEKGGDERFCRKIMRMLDEIQHDVRQIRTEMASIREARGPSLLSLPSSCPGLPCEKPEDLSQLESVLVDASIFQNICNFLSSIGGNSVKDCVKRILCRLVSNRLALNYNWKGTRGVKLGFSSFVLVNKLIFSAVRNTSCFGAATEMEVHNNIKNWLMHAKDRTSEKRPS